MIYLYYGKIGDGKTYHVVRNELLPAVAKGRKVYTNIDELNLVEIEKQTGKKPDIVHWSTVEDVAGAVQLKANDKEGHSLKVDRGALLIVDECQWVWDARAFGKMPKETLTLMEYHRHFGLDLVLISQSPGRIDRAVLRLLNESYQVKNLRILGGVFDSFYIINVRQSPGDREVVGTIRGRYVQSVFRCYRSALVGSKFKIKKTGLSRVGIIAGPAFAVISLVFYLRSGGLNVINGRSGVKVGSADKPPAVVDSGARRSDVSQARGTLVGARSVAQQIADVKAHLAAEFEDHRDGLGGLAPLGQAAETER